jgi:hypothetical protein
LERLLSLGDLQTDTLQEVEATLNLIQGSRRISEIPFYVQQHQQQQQQQQQQHYQLQQRVATNAFYASSKHLPVIHHHPVLNEYYPAGPFEPVCHIKQEAVDDDERLHQQQFHQLGSSTFHTLSSESICYDSAGNSFIENLQSYIDANGSNVDVSKLDEIVKHVEDVDPLHRIMSDFDRAASATLSQESDLVRTLLNFHCDAGRISKFDARRLITCLAETFKQFAESQPPFQAISGADQFRLLVRIVNRPIKANSNRFVRGKLKIDIRCVEADNRHWSDKTDRQATKRVTLGRHYHEEKECDKG